jgi:hypothetical protein
MKDHGSVTWATLSAIAGIIIGLAALTKLAINPIEERVEALRTRLEAFESRGFVRLDRIEDRLGKLERNGDEPQN